MNKKKAKLVYKANSFDIIQEGDHVVCAISGKEIPLNQLTYWDVEAQEAYYSPAEINKRLSNIGKKK